MQILQLNLGGGFDDKISEIISYLEDKEIKIAALQETWLNPESKIRKLGNFILLRKDRLRNKAGGVAFLIHKDVQFEPLFDHPADPFIEYIAIKVANINIVNVYIPPESSCFSGHVPDLTYIFSIDDSIVLGDFNCHDPLWHSTIWDERGEKVADQIGLSNFGVLNRELHTRIPKNGQPTSPDISLASLSLLPSTIWSTDITLSSDHVPIIVQLSTDTQFTESENRTFTNFNKAKWPEFEDFIEKEIEKQVIPTDVSKATQVITKIINKASNLFIPQGRIKDIITEIPTEAAAKILERDGLRKRDPSDPEITRLDCEIKKSIHDHHEQKWRTEVGQVSRGCSAKLFKLLKRLNGQSQTRSNQAIRFKGKYLSCPRACADEFNKQYSSVVPHKSSTFSRIIKKQVRKNKIVDSPIFTPEQTKKAIKACRASKALGPDKISNLHLKFIGPLAIKYLTDVFNLSMTTSIVPDIWKTSTIIPLLKPGKDASESKSYRPVSLLCPAIKVLERLILPTLDENLPVPDYQHGFRKFHSTVTALNEFNLNVTNGFTKKLPRPDRTVLVQLDLSKAFDMVSHDKLLKDLNNTTLPPGLKRWMNSYLRGRQSRVSFRGKLSKSRNIHTGVPQGAVTSPLLFSFYLSKLPLPSNSKIQLIMYADDISIFMSGYHIPSLTRELNKYLPALLDYLEERELLVSPEKSTVTLFTPDNHEFHKHPGVKKCTGAPRKDSQTFGGCL